jgi:hypothetical protein
MSFSWSVLDELDVFCYRVLFLLAVCWTVNRVGLSVFSIQMNIICVATEETQGTKYLYQFLFFEFLSLFGKMDSDLRMPCGVDHSWSTSDRCYNRRPRGLPLHTWSILLSLWIDLYHIQISDTACWIWNIWTVSHVVKAHADGTWNNWNDESNQKCAYFDFLSFPLDAKRFICIAPWRLTDDIFHHQLVRTNHRLCNDWFPDHCSVFCGEKRIFQCCVFVLEIASLPICTFVGIQLSKDLIAFSLLFSSMNVSFVSGLVPQWNNRSKYQLLDWLIGHNLL